MLRRVVPLCALALLAVAAVTASGPARPVLSATAPKARGERSATDLRVALTGGVRASVRLSAQEQPPSPSALARVSRAAAATAASEAPATGQAPTAAAPDAAAPVAATPTPPGDVQPEASPVPMLPGARVRVPVLMYHVLGDGPNSLYVSVADFRAQMDWLQKNGYHTVTLMQLYRNQTKGDPLPDKPIVLTFDDGYASFYTVGYPAFKQHHFTAVLFAVPGFFGRPGYVTAQQVLEMDRGGMEIESHTMRHLDLPSLSDEALHHEVFDSKKELEQALGHAVQFFCYPSGSYNIRVLKFVKEAGYLAGLTTKYGAVTPDTAPLEWRRVRISQGTSLAGFASEVKGASA